MPWWAWILVAVFAYGCVERAARFLFDNPLPLSGDPTAPPKDAP